VSARPLLDRSARRALLRLVDRAVAALETRAAVAPSPGDGAPGDALARRAFLGTLARTSGSALAAAYGASLLAACGSRGPDGAASALAYATRKNEGVERWLFRHTAMDHARGPVAGDAFPSYFVSPMLPVWDATVRGPWALEVTGLVDRPQRLTLDALVRLPHRQQRVHHYCVEGWTAVATWWGVRVADLARLAGARPEARYVDFQSFDAGYHESWDLESALHPQTLVAYAKDGRYLPPAYGAPARVHSPVKLGYKNTKYLTRVVFQAERNGGYWSDQGYEWYGGT
jgi:DMSO/TMAO reductase YedYZ molybdopterin-dependent catalytic subunit